MSGTENKSGLPGSSPQEKTALSNSEFKAFRSSRAACRLVAIGQIGFGLAARQTPRQSPVGKTVPVCNGLAIDRRTCRFRIFRQMGGYEDSDMPQGAWSWIPGHGTIHIIGRWFVHGRTFFA